MHEQIVVTTSWDDGHPCDLRLAEMLAERGLGGTFYVPFTGPDGRSTLHPNDLRSLSRAGFEIGAHTVSHPMLAGMRGKRLWEEVALSKQMLEQILGQEVAMFCYPRGYYDRRVLRAVQEAGYLGARSTRMLSYSSEFRRFEMPTTLQAYPHPPLDYLKNLGKRRDLVGLCRYLTRWSRYGSWVEMGKRLFDRVLQEGGVWHLYGHSWEIEELNLWSGLSQLLDHVCNRPGVIYPSNGRVPQLGQQDGRLSRIAEVV